MTDIKTPIDDFIERHKPEPLYIVEKPWRRSEEFPIRVKDMFLKGKDFAWQYTSGIILTENEISEYSYGTIKNLIRLKRKNAIRSLEIMYEEDVEFCRDLEQS